IEGDAGFERDRAGIGVDLVFGAVAADDLIGDGRAAIGIDARDGADHGAGERVLGDIVVGQRGVGGGFVDVGDVDGEGLVGGETALIGDAHGDAVGAVGLVIEGDAGFERDRAGIGVDLVFGAVAADDLIGEGRAAIGIDARDGADHG